MRWGGGGKGSGAARGSGFANLTVPGLASRKQTVSTTSWVRGASGAHEGNKGHACLSSCTRLFLFIFFEIQLLLFMFIKNLSISVLGEREPGGSLRRIPGSLGNLESL